MAFRAQQIFINLPVKDLKRSMAFFGEIGFEFDMNFTDDNAACMAIGENMYAMLLVEDYFRTFVAKDIANAEATAEAIFALSVDSREEVDAVVSQALAAGGKPSSDKADHGFMYQWSFQDVDHHLWEVFYMDMNAAQDPDAAQP
ncbi:VOC family protein [Paenibacillus aurantiacus]|uniref:VOC family protein n=1 Tax=Paenibacillus aurantiacus TaxID=1936118 RepID=A0ABV5KT50_9BACL